MEYASTPSSTDKFFKRDGEWIANEHLPQDDVIVFGNDELARMRQVITDAVERTVGRESTDPTRWHTRDSQWEIDWYAVQAEYAIAKAFGLSLGACDIVNLGITKVCQSCDMVIPTDPPLWAEIKGVNVLTKWNHNMHFTVKPERERFQADIGIFVYCLQPRLAWLRGWFTAEDWRTKNVLLDLGSGKKPQYGADDTRKIPSLLRLPRISSEELSHPPWNPYDLQELLRQMRTGFKGQPHQLDFLGRVGSGVVSPSRR
jgi:hypothetical protein